jgi:hypothetical protein
MVMERWYAGWMVSWLVVGCVGDSKEIGATVSATLGGSDSETESTSAADYSDSFEPGSGSCESVPGDHTAVCPTNDGCAVVVDVELRCSPELAAPSRIHADPDAITLTAVGDGRPWLFEVRTSDDVTATELPEEAGTFLAKGATTLFVAQSREATDRPGLHALVREDGQWREELVLARPDPNRDLTLHDFGIVDGQPSAWIKTDRYDGIFARVNRATDGAWSDEPAVAPNETRVSPSFRSLDGGTLSFDIGGGTVTSTFDGGAPTEWAHPLGTSWREYQIVPDVELTADNLPMPALLANDEDIVVTWGPETGLDDDLVAVDVPDLPILVNPCNAITDDCNKPCEIEAVGTGELYGGYRVVRTADGVAWVVTTLTHLKESWTYTPGEGEEMEYCVNHPSDEGSTGELRVYRVDAIGSAPVQVLTMSIEAPIRDGITATAAGNEIAIAFVVWDGGRGVSDESAIRVLRLDTGLLVAD